MTRYLEVSAPEVPLAVAAPTRQEIAMSMLSLTACRSCCFQPRYRSVVWTQPETGARKTVTKTKTPDLGLSPDGCYLLWSQIDAVGSDLMLVENFR